MLKTLEEPPEYLKFVLATTDPQKVPVTVLSRCLQFNLRPMAPETVFEHLERVLAAETIAADAMALRLLARAARGSMRDALSLTDQAIAFGGGVLREDMVRQMLGSVGRGPVLALIDALACGDGASVVATVDALRRQGIAAASTLEEMTDVLQRMAVAQLAQVEPDPADPDSAEIARLAQALPADQTQLLYSLCLQGRTELGLAPDEYAALVMVLLRLLAFQPPGWGGEKKNRSRLSDATTTAPNGPPSPQPAVAPAPTPVSVRVPTPTPTPAPAPIPITTSRPSSPTADVVMWTDHKPVQAASLTEALQPKTADAAPQEGGTLGQFWTTVVQDMLDAERITALVRELALQSQLMAREGEGNATVWRLQVENRVLDQMITRERLQQALAQHGQAVRLEVSVGPAEDTPAKRLAAAAARQLQQAEHTLRQDPFVQEMMKAFGGTIVPGSLQAITMTVD